VVIAILRARLSVGVFLAILLVCLPAISLSFAADEKDVKVQTLRQTAKQLLDVGYEQYHRGMYDNARETLGKAAAYREYLSVSDVSKLDTLLERLSSQPVPDANLPPPAEAGSVKSGQVVVKTVVEQQAEPNVVEQSATIQQTEPNVVEQPAAIQQAEPNVVKQPETIQQPEPNVVEQPIQTQPQVEQSVANPEVEFLPIEANDINRPPQLPAPVIPTEVRPEFITPAPQEPNLVVEVNQPPQPRQVQPQVPAAEKAKEDYIEVIKQKQRIQQSYTKAVVNEAIAKAKEYADKEDFLKAKDEISRASAVIEKNKPLLGDTDYAQYRDSLRQLLDQINTRQAEIERLKAEKAKAEAKAAQEKLREQQATDRQKRIQDLLAGSMEYQEQQRYPEALAQIETLLAIDSTNREAIRNKQMLEDIINLRRQLEVKKEMGKEEEAILTETQKSMIPHTTGYREVLTYPRNWQDIAKREPKMITGLAPADAAVYKQLDTVVDLSALTPDTPFEEAIETIRTSVDPPLKIVVRWKDLEENAYVERDTVIGMQGLNGITVGKALKELLNSVSGGVTTIDFAVEDGIITIATSGSLPPRLVTHVYDVTELIGAPADFRSELQTTEVTGGGGTVTDTAPIVAQNAATLVQMIQETIAPMSWLVNGGEGTISLHGTRLVISQTPQIHEQIQKLLMEDLRESLGQQVSIESRFLFVTENFLEDIGLGINSLFIGGHDKLGPMQFNFGQYENAAPLATLVPGSIPATPAPPLALNLVGGLSYGSLLDDLAVSFFLKATQAHRDAKMLTAPRVTVLSGESAYIRITREDAYVSDYEFEDITAAGAGSAVRVIADATVETVTGGVVLNVTPTITADKKYVILQISANYTKTTFEPFSVSSTLGDQFAIELPALEVSEVQTRVSVPDGGTLLIGGQKLAAEANREAGVPGVSKVPILGRLFSHRSKVKDQNILLILVKPSIILQQEAERQYFAPLQ
jgi:type II secretory pathway component GspD/PulD (secretin)